MATVTAKRRALEAHLDVAHYAGCPVKLDALARLARPEHGFLRAAWYAAGGADRCILAERDGAPVAAFPTVAAGPPALGARSLAGIYWPFRGPLLAADLGAAAATQLLTDIRRQNLLGPVWRMGPVYRDDAGVRLLTDGARDAGWTMLTRNLGRTYILDIAAARGEEPWPRPSMLKRLEGYRRTLSKSGRVSVDRIVGKGWTPSVFDALATIEARSWVAATDRTGAKFIAPQHRRIWERCVADPELAAMLSAVIVRLDDRPIAFSLDLTAGETQYGIAGTYDQDFGKLNVGKLANETNLVWSAERGVTRFDWGAGDSGYKRKTGFVAGSEIDDYLFVRSGAVAGILRGRWEREPVSDGEDGRSLPIGPRESLLIASLVAAAAVTAMAE